MDMLDHIVERECEQAQARLTPIQAKDIKGKNILNVLTDLVKSWPLQDLRLNPDINGTATDPTYIRDMARGLKLKVAHKELETNTVEFKVMTLTNLDEYERYNLAVETHNDQYEAAGEPSIAFDPIHGTTKRVIDKHMSRISVPNEHDQIPDDDLPTTHPKPQPRRATILTLKYHIVQMGTIKFKLGYAAEDRAGRTIYYNEIEGTDLAALVRQSIQELWGNPSVYGMHGNLLEGIPLLIQGKKLNLCQNNTKPLWVKGAHKTINTDLFIADIAQTGLGFIGIVTGYIIPTLLALTMVLIALKGLTGLDPVTEEWAEGTGYTFLWGMGLILVGLWVTFKVTAYLNEKAATINMKKKFF